MAIVAEKKNKAGSRIPNREEVLTVLSSMMDKGELNQRVMSEKLGIAPSTVCTMIKEVHSERAEGSPKKRSIRRQIRISQLAYIHKKALERFETSCIDEFELTVISVDCESCTGTGSVPSGTGTDIGPVDCVPCKGTGKIKTEKTRVKPTAGNPAFIKLAISSVVEMGKLEGSYADTNTANANARAFLKTTRLKTGNEVTESQEAYYDVPVDLLLEAKKTIEKLKVEANSVIEVDNTAKSTKSTMSTK